MSSNSDDSDDQSFQLKEDNPENVTYSFLKTGKSYDIGVLLTHEDSYKFHKAGSNKSGNTHWYVCAEKRTGCPARATVRRHEAGDNHHVLADVSTPDHHSHEPTKDSIYTEKLLVQIKPQIEKDTQEKRRIRTELKMSDNDEDAGPGPNNYQFTPSTTDKIFNCGQCDFSYKTIKQIMVHVRSSPNHEAVCVQCNGRYKSFDKLRAHLRKIHFQVGEVICNDCGKMSKTKDQHEQHYNQVHRVEKDLFCNLCGVECQNMIKLRKHTKLCLNKDPMKSERERMENSRINNCKNQEVLLTLEKYLEYQKNLELQKLAKIMASPKKRMKLTSSVKNEKADDRINSLLMELQQKEKNEENYNTSEKNDGDCSDEDEREFLENIKDEIKPKEEREDSPEIDPEMLLEVKCEEPSDEEFGESQDYDNYDYYDNHYEIQEPEDSSNQEDSNFNVASYGEDSLNGEEEEEEDDEDDFDPRYFAATSLQEEEIKKEEKPKCIYAGSDGKCTYQHQCPEPQHPCPVGSCGQKFHSKTEVRTHVKEEHSGADQDRTYKKRRLEDGTEAKFPCAQCGEGFKSQVKLKKHMMDHHMGSFETFNCNLCTKIFFNEKTLKKHCSSKHPETTAGRKCVWCEEVVKDLRRHRVEEHGDIMAIIKKSLGPTGVCVCHLCGKQIGKQLNFETHLRKMHGELLLKTGSDSMESLYCEDCGQDFVNARDLRLHRKQTHDRHFYVKVCPECGKEVMDLPTHMKAVHPDPNDEKDYPCKNCGQIFRSVRDLKLHKRRDHGKEICPICGKLASRDHINNVHKIQPVQCEICFAEMRNRTALRKHKNSVHAPAQRVTCNECGQVFENKVKLYAHTYQVHNYQESKCEWCGGTYKNKKLLQAHKRVMHKDVYIGRDTQIYKPNMALDHPVYN